MTRASRAVSFDSCLLSVQTDSVDQATDLAEAATHDDPEVGLAAVVALRGLLDQLEALQVKAARE